MSWIVPWNGAEIDADPNDLTGRELSEIKRVSGFAFKQLVGALREMDLEAYRVLFWALDRRRQPDLKYSDYDGPTPRWVGNNIDSFVNDEDVDDPGKAPTPATSGSPSSPTDTDTPDTSTTT